MDIITILILVTYLFMIMRSLPTSPPELFIYQREVRIMAIQAGEDTFYQAKRGIIQDGLVLNLDAAVNTSYNGGTSVEEFNWK